VVLSREGGQQRFAFLTRRKGCAKKDRQDFAAFFACAFGIMSRPGRKSNGLCKKGRPKSTFSGGAEAKQRQGLFFKTSGFALRGFSDYICLMDFWTVIGIISSVLGIFSVLKNDIPVFSLFKKSNLRDII